MDDEHITKIKNHQEELSELNEDISRLREINEQFNKLVVRQGNDLIDIEKNVTVTDDTIVVAEHELSTAGKIKKTLRSKYVYLAVGGLMILNLPIGLTLGLKALAISGSLTGATSVAAIIGNRVANR